MTELEYNEFLKSETDLEREANLHSLEHYGVKGMKWGVRKDRSHTPRHGTKRRKKADSVRRDRVNAYANRRTMSDDELRTRINRLQLEKQFRDLSEGDLHRGRKMVKDILATAGPQAMKTMAAGAILYGGKVAMTQNFNWKEAADYITPKPKKK